MTIEHANIPDGFLHEPKGISSASAGQAYYADGLGSGVWTDVIVELSNFTEVTAPEDFPAAVNGIITLEAGQGYILSGNVDISPNRILMGVGSTMLGFNRVTDVLTSDTSGALVSSENIDVSISGITLDCPNGKLLALSGTGAEVVLLSKTLFGTQSFKSDIGGFRSIVIDNSGLRGSFPAGGILFNGSNGELVLRDSSFSGFLGVLFDLGVATFQFIELIGSRYTGGNTSAQVLEGLANAGNISGLIGTGSSCLFAGMDNPIGTNITPATSKWFFSSNVGVPDSSFVGYCSMANNGIQTTIPAIDTWTKVAGTTVPSVFNERFIQSASNEFTANILLERPVDIAITVSAIKSGGGADEVEFTVFKDSGSGFVQLNNTVVSTIQAESKLRTCSIIMLDKANPGDKYSLYTRNTSSTDNVEVRDLQFDIRG